MKSNKSKNNLQPSTFNFQFISLNEDDSLQRDCHGEQKCNSRLAMTCRAFTFAELMVSLVIIAVITTLLYPTISEISPNNNKQLYRSAYKTVELTIQDIIDSEEPITTSHELCEAFKSRLNTVSWKEGADTCHGCDGGSCNEEIHTSNGMNWWFQSFSDGKHTLYVDVNASNNGNNAAYLSKQCDSGCDSALADPTNFCNGTSSSNWTHGCFRVNDSTMRDTFKINISTDGTVDPTVDTIGAKHLRDDSN